MRATMLLTSLITKPAIVVAYSFGARAAAELVMRYPTQARALELIDAALGLTAPSPDLRFCSGRNGSAKMMVSPTITNPLATELLRQSPVIEKTERALPEHLEILQRPTGLRDSTSDIADWLAYFLGDDRAAESADRNSCA